ncbi:MAG: sigma-70 family RNA polymerase sigma factor [Planctomycetota bacterium]
MEDLSTAELLRRVRRRDEAAFAILVKRHRAVLLRTARGLLGPAGAYEDVVQETFWKLCRRPPRLRSEAPELQDRQLGGWLLQVTRNHCMDHVRQETRRRNRERLSARAESTAGGLDQVETRDQGQHAEQLMQELPPAQREVLVLRLCADKSYREIANLTNRTVGTVGWLISEGLKELGQRFEASSTRPADTEAKAASLLRSRI